MVDEQDILNSNMFSKITSYCASAEHCSYEVQTKLANLGADDEQTAWIMAYLIREKYIDDTRYCELFVEDKIRFNGWGRRKIEQALYQKRIDKSISTPVLNAVDDELYLEVLRPLLKSKAATIKARNEYEMNMKLIRFAMGRGFGFNLIKQCLSGEMDEVDE